MGKTAAKAAEKAAEGDPPPDGGRDAFTPRLRILNKQSWRGSFRLEEVFWSILEEAAEAHGRRLNDYVHGLLAAAPENANKSSLLRAHAAKWQRERARAAQDLPPVVENAVAACPVPCFVMGPDRRIRLFNSRFIHYLRGPDGGALAGADPRITFQMPLTEIVDTLRTAPGKVVDCNLRAVVPGRTVEGRARICLIGDTGGEWRIMGFVVG